MCFSAEASFGAVAILSIAGIGTIKKSETSSQIAFASIPLIFASQQLMEGWVWINLLNPNNATWKQIPIYGFLFFAQIIWPIWVPFSILLLEKRKTQKIILSVFFGIGILLALVLLYCLISYTVSATITQHHIRYMLDYPYWLRSLGGIFYFIPTVFSCFISSVKRMPLLGVAIFTSFIISKLFFNDYVISIWCFFSAIISVLVYLILKQQKTETERT